MTDRLAPPPPRSASPAEPEADPDRIPFAPVPLASTRHDGLTAPRQRAFIDALAQLGQVRAAAAAVGMSAKSAYTLRKRPGAESLTAAWDVAIDEGHARAVSTAIQRALEGETVPVFYRGKQIGERRRYNDRLLIAVLRAVDPAWRAVVTNTRSPLGRRGKTRT